jgi:cytochrome c oxidase subunit 2
MRSNRMLQAIPRAVPRGLFAAVGLLLALSAAGCAGDPWHLMPESASHEADRVDELTYLIIWLTMGTLVGVQVVLLWFLWAYRRKPGVKAKHTHGNHTVELIWTVTPAAILVFLAVYQMGLWSEVKASGAPSGRTGRSVKAQIIARQYEWHFRYPGKDEKFGTDDDLITEGALVVPVNSVVEIEQRAMDVIHSFYLPNLRFKQDVVPGLHTKLWFQPTKLSAERKPIQVVKNEPPMVLDYWDIVCAELCGSGHTGMAARLYVVTDAEYDEFLAGKPLTKLLALRGTNSATGQPYTGTETRKVAASTWDRTATRGADALWIQWSEQDDQTVKKAPAKPKHPFAHEEEGSEEDE